MSHLPKMIPAAMLLRQMPFAAEKSFKAEADSYESAFASKFSKPIKPLAEACFI